MTNETKEFGPGKYLCHAIGFQVGVAGTGIVQIGVRLKLNDFTERSVTWYGYMSPKAMDRTVKALRLMGWRGSDISELEDPDIKLDNEVEVTIGEEEYQGQVRLKAQWINEPGSGGMKTVLSGNDLKAKAKELQTQILASDPSNASKYAASTDTKKAKPKQNNPPVAPDGPDEDLPF